MKPISRRQPRPATGTGDCRAQLTELFAYLDGELSEARCRAIERHLTSCECCDGLAAGLRRAIAVCRASGGERLPPRVRARAQARVARLLNAGAVPNGVDGGNGSDTKPRSARGRTKRSR